MKTLAGNWKLFKNKSQTKEFFAELKQSSEFPHQGLQSIIATSPTLLETAALSSSGLGIEIFSQNCAWSAEGALTGEISPLQILDSGATGTLVGHSERRQFFGDRDESVLKRALCALEHGLKVIYCVGESFEERKAGLTLQVLRKQIEGLRKEILPHAKEQNFMLAYEPVWAIGTGLVADKPQIAEAHDFLRSELEMSQKSGWKLLYGGSVKPDNLRGISEISAVDGALVGGASLEAKSYIALKNCLI